MKYVQHDIFGNAPVKKSRKVLTPDEIALKKEKAIAHYAFKKYKASGFKKDILTDEERALLAKHYNC